MTDKQKKKTQNSIEEKRMNYIKIAVIIAIAVASFFVIRNISLEEIKAWVLGHGAWAAVIYVATFVILPIFFFPVPVIVLAGGTIFGLFKGSLYTMIGLSLIHI